MPDGLRIVRGEFHRHSEISMDGGTDGAIVDQFRYAIDSGSLGLGRLLRSLERQRPRVHMVDDPEADGYLL